MAISNTVENATYLAQNGSAQWVPFHEKGANIVDQSRFGFINLLGGEDIDPKGAYDTTKKRMVPALIKSERTNTMEPKIDTYVTLPVKFKADGAETGLSSGSTAALDLDSTEGLKKYDLLRDRSTGSVVRVDSITSSTIVSVYPHAGGTSGDGSDDIADNADFDVIGSAYPDGSNFGNGLTSTPDQESNYMQFHVTEYGIGKLAEQQHRFPGENNQEATFRMNALIRHNRARENAFIFGKKAANTSVSAEGTVYSMDGLVGLSSRTINAGGAITMDEWNLAIMPEIVKLGGSGDLRAITGYQPLATFGNIARDYIRTSQEDKVFGNLVERIRTSVGDLTLHASQPMDDRNGEIIVFNPQLLKRKYLGELNNIHVESVQTQNAIKKTNAYLTAETLLPRNKDSIVTVTNINA